MAEPHNPQVSAEARALGSALVALTPVLAMLASARAFVPFGGDDGLLAAALELTPASAHGHPLATLLAALFARLPLGPLPLRVALSSSAALALAAAALYGALEQSAGAGSRARSLVRSPLAVAVLLFAFGSDALFASEPRAFALSIALACAYLERVSALQAHWPRLSLHALRGAAFWLALLALEQPMLAALLIAGSFGWLRRVARAYRLPAAQWVACAAGVPVALGALALCLRGAPRAPAAWLAQSALATFALAQPLPFASRIAALAPAPSALLLGALLVLVRFARQPGERRAHGLWLGVTAAAFGASLVLERPAAAFALALCAAAASCALLLGELLAGGERLRLASIVALCALLLGISHLRAAAVHASTRDAGAADVLREPLLRSLPPRSLLLVATDTADGLRAAALEERVRPDVRIAPKPWQLDLAASETLARAQPELQPLLRATLLQGELPLTELLALAARRPLLLELDPARERALYPVLLPWGVYHQVSSSAVSRSDERFGARDADARRLALDAVLDTEAAARADCNDWLAARARAEADYYASAGDPGHAAQSSERARSFGTDPAH